MPSTTISNFTRCDNMKTTLIVLALFLSSATFAQTRQNKKIDALYHSDNFILSYLVLPASVYNPFNDTTISRIDFYQDTTARYKVRTKTFASIDYGQSMNIDYIIGYIGLFQATEYTVNVIIKTTYKDGSETTQKKTIHFDDIIAPEYGVESATYGTLSEDHSISTF